MSRESLCVGINDYDWWPMLNFCEGDARKIAELLDDTDEGLRWSTPGRSLLLGAQAREMQIRHHFEDLFGMDDGNDILFYFSGHADKLKDGDLLLSSVEDDPADENGRHGVRFSELMDAIRRHERMNTATIILDCCYSGAIRNIDVPRNVTVLAAARDSQQATEINGHGIFTSSLIAGLEGGSADVLGNVTAMSLYADASAAIDYRSAHQQPVIKACLEKMIVLRHVPIGLSQQQLRRLHDATDPRPERKGRPLFGSVNAVFHPYPEMESSGANEGKMRTGDEAPDSLTPSQRLMDDFKAWRDARLITIDADNGTHDLYWACVDGGSIRLTPRGKHYWSLIAKDLL